MDTAAYQSYGCQIKSGNLESDQMALAICQLPDPELEGLVAKSLPPDTYTGIYVKTIRYIFPENRKESVLTRHIILRLSNGENIRTFFHSLFAGLGFLPQSDCYEKTINATKLKKELVESIFQGKQEWEEIRIAYKQAAKIDLYVAQNLQYISLAIDESTFVIPTYAAGKGLRCIGTLALAVFQMFHSLQDAETKDSTSVPA